MQQQGDLATSRHTLPPHTCSRRAAAHREKSSLLGVTSRSPFLPPPPCCCFCCCFCFCCLGCCCCCCSVATSPATVDSASRPRRASCRLLPRCAALHSLQAAEGFGSRQWISTSGAAGQASTVPPLLPPPPPPGAWAPPQPEGLDQAAHRRQPGTIVRVSCMAAAGLCSACIAFPGSLRPVVSTDAPGLRRVLMYGRCRAHAVCWGGPLWRQGTSSELAVHGAVWRHRLALRLL